MAAVVVGRHHSDWLTQFFEPDCNLLLLLLPRKLARAGTRAGKYVAFLATVLNKFNKIVAPEVLRRIFAARPTAKCEILQPALQQMIVTQPRNGPVVQADK